MNIKHTKRGTPVLDVSGYEIEYVLDAYRYVSHTDKIASTGFSLIEELKRNSDCILATDDAIARAEALYRECYGG